MKRRDFINTAGATMMSSMMVDPLNFLADNKNFLGAKKRIALVGTGIRGISSWGKPVQEKFKASIEFVALCDINPGRVAYAKKVIGVNCPTFTDFDEMLSKTRPELVVVTTVDATHDIFIIKALEFGCDVVTEKPMTTDEIKCQAILDAERKTGKKVIVAFNYRHGTHFTAIKEILSKTRIGKITSVDFHWYLNTFHGASYFNRWHGEMKYSGSLLVHKSTHHFDLLNWWLNSDPVEVFAYGSLDHYGKNNSFRGTNCRSCEHKKTCKFYYDIAKDGDNMNLYAANEKYDGYIRDKCLWRTDIDIFDKMAVQIKYANNVQVSYSLTTYSPFEGLTLAFNGLNGRMDTWQDIPWLNKGNISQEEKHAREMSQTSNKPVEEFNEIMISDNFGKTEQVKIPLVLEGHGGGDARLQNYIFGQSNKPDPYKHMAGTRDGAMSILIGIAARKSIAEKRPVKIAELTDITPHATRGVSV
jgi:predicted dehydrogenase